MCAKVFLKSCKLFVRHFCLVFIKMFVRLLKVVLKIVQSKLLWILIAMFLVMNCIRNCDNDCSKSVKKSSNPVIVWWTGTFPGTRETRTCSRTIKCDIYSNKNATFEYATEAYLFYGSSIDVSNLPPRNANDIWALYHEESPRNLEVLMHEPMLNLFNFSATFSRYSNVPYPLQYIENNEDIISTKYFVSTAEKNKLLNELAPVMYLYSDCETATERDLYVKELMKYINVDSYGACLTNKALPEKFKEDYLNKLNDDDFLKFVARYKFVVAIENGVCEDYVTEKFWRAIKVGSVPIYFGSPSIRDWFPNNKSAILLDDFTTPEVLSKHLKKLLDNDTLYEEYLEHKTKQIIMNKRLLQEREHRPYQSDGLETIEEFECFICEKVHNKLNIGINIVNKSHYDCPEPVSALTLGVNPSNHWVQSWKHAKRKAERIYKMLTSE